MPCFDRHKNIVAEICRDEENGSSRLVSWVDYMVLVPSRMP